MRLNQNIEKRVWHHANTIQQAADSPIEDAFGLAVMSRIAWITPAPYRCAEQVRDILFDKITRAHGAA